MKMSLCRDGTVTFQMWVFWGMSTGDHIQRSAHRWLLLASSDSCSAPSSVEWSALQIMCSSVRGHVADAYVNPSVFRFHTVQPYDVMGYLLGLIRRHAASQLSVNSSGYVSKPAGGQLPAR